MSKQRVKTQKLSEILVIILNRALIRVACQQSKIGTLRSAHSVMAGRRRPPAAAVTPDLQVEVRVNRHRTSAR